MEELDQYIGKNYDDVVQQMTTYATSLNKIIFMKDSRFGSIGSRPNPDIDSVMILVNNDTDKIITGYHIY